MSDLQAKDNILKYSLPQFLTTFVYVLSMSVCGLRERQRDQQADRDKDGACMMCVCDLFDRYISDIYVV